MPSFSLLPFSLSFPLAFLALFFCSLPLSLPSSKSSTSSPPHQFSASIVPLLSPFLRAWMWCLLTLYCLLLSTGFKIKSRSRFFSSSKRTGQSVPFRSQDALRNLGCALVPGDFKGADSGVQDAMYRDSGSRLVFVFSLSVATLSGSIMARLTLCGFMQTRPISAVPWQARRIISRIKET